MNSYRDDEAPLQRGPDETVVDEHGPSPGPPRDYGRDVRQQHGYDHPYGYEQSYGYGYGGPPSLWQMRPRRQYPIETKPFFLTSEFGGAVLGILGIAITAAASDSFGAWRAWILITGILIGYMVARGIAKSGTRSNAPDPREQLDLGFGRHRKQDDN